MARRSTVVGWLTRPFRRRDKDSAAEPLVLDNPVDRSQPYNNMMLTIARFQIGQVVKHKFFPFRGLIFDVDPQLGNTEEWYESIPEEVRPKKNQPFYHLFAENDRTHYVAYVSEQNLVLDDSEIPLSHPDIQDWFDVTPRGTYELKKGVAN